MKKLIYTLVLMLTFSGVANAESIVVIDSDGRVTKQIYTTPTTYTSTTTAASPTVTVVRESPVISNSYYYDRDATMSALAAGVTTAVIGGLIFDGFHHHKHKPYRVASRPKHNHRPHAGKPQGRPHGKPAHRR